MLYKLFAKLLKIDILEEIYKESVNSFIPMTYHDGCIDFIFENNVAYMFEDESNGNLQITIEVYDKDTINRFEKSKEYDLITKVLSRLKYKLALDWHNPSVQQIVDIMDALHAHQEAQVFKNSKILGIL